MFLFAKSKKHEKYNKKAYQLGFEASCSSKLLSFHFFLMRVERFLFDIEGENSYISI